MREDSLPHQIFSKPRYSVDLKSFCLQFDTVKVRRSQHGEEKE